MRSRLTACAVMGMALVAGSEAGAALIAYDGFDYSSSTLNGESGGVGFGANAWSAVSGQGNPALSAGSLEYTIGGQPLATVGGKVTPGTTNRSTRNFENAIDATGQTLWASFRINHTGTAALPTNHAGFSMFGGANGSGAELFLGKPGSATNWGLDTSSQNAVQRTGAVTTTGDRDALLLYKLDFTTSPGTISMWVNPTTLDEGALGAAHATSTEANANFVSMRVSTGGNASNFQFDEFRLGTTFADVVPVPEPTVAGVAVAGAVLAGARRRRTR